MKGVTFQKCEFTTLCYAPSWLCDGANDCGDFSDERNCPGNPDLSETCAFSQLGNKSFLSRSFNDVLVASNSITGLFLWLRKQQSKVSNAFLRLPERTLHTPELDLR